MASEHLTMEELRRAEAWLICLNDAMAYIALARQKESFVNCEAVVKYSGGSMSVEMAIDKGLVSAALVSAGQIFKNGRDGVGISDNHAPNLRDLRALLFKCSDEGNSLPQGESERIFKEFVSELRDGFVSHYDGNRANIAILDTRGHSISWRPPNPDFRVEAFGDLEKVLFQMHRSLRVFTIQQRAAVLASRSEE